MNTIANLLVLRVDWSIGCVYDALLFDIICLLFSIGNGS